MVNFGLGSLLHTCLPIIHEKSRLSTICDDIFDPITCLHIETQIYRKPFHYNYLDVNRSGNFRLAFRQGFPAERVLSLLKLMVTIFFSPLLFSKLPFVVQIGVQTNRVDNLGRGREVRRLATPGEESSDNRRRVLQLDYPCRLDLPQNFD